MFKELVQKNSLSCLVAHAFPVTKKHFETFNNIVAMLHRCYNVVEMFQNVSCLLDATINQQLILQEIK